MSDDTEFTYVQSFKISLTDNRYFVHIVILL